jgi:hypothetical protein
LCGVLEYASAEILIFLELAQKSLVSASRTAQFPPEFLDGNGLVPAGFGNKDAAVPLFGDLPDGSSIAETGATVDRLS